MNLVVLLNIDLIEMISFQMPIMDIDHRKMNSYFYIT